MRADILRNRKGIHIELLKEVHTTFRMKLLEHELSMQEVLNEFAALVAIEDQRAMKIIENLTAKKMKARLEGRPIHSRGNEIGELDREAVYNLIEKHEE